jgi:hypothetical protein
LDRIEAFRLGPTRRGFMGNHHVETVAERAPMCDAWTMLPPRERPEKRPPRRPHRSKGNIA